MTRLCDFISKLPDMLLLDILMLTNHLPSSLMMKQLVIMTGFLLGGGLKVEKASCITCLIER